MSKDNGGPAFPTTPEHTMRLNGEGGKGMTLRDFFATKIDRDEYGDILFHHMSRDAEEALLADKHPAEPIPSATSAERAAYRLAVVDWALRIRAALRYRMADAMLLERDK